MYISADHLKLFSYIEYIFLYKILLLHSTPQQQASAKTAKLSQQAKFFENKARFQSLTSVFTGGDKPESGHSSTTSYYQIILSSPATIKRFISHLDKKHGTVLVVLNSIGGRGKQKSLLKKKFNNDTLYAFTPGKDSQRLLIKFDPNFREKLAKRDKKVVLLIKTTV